MDLDRCLGLRAALSRTAPCTTFLNAGLRISGLAHLLLSVDRVCSSGFPVGATLSPGNSSMGSKPRTFDGGRISVGTPWGSDHAGVICSSASFVRTAIRFVFQSVAGFPARGWFPDGLLLDYCRRGLRNSQPHSIA